MTENNEKSLKIPKGIIRINKSTDNTVAKRKNTMGTTRGARTVYSSGEPELTTGIECGSLPHMVSSNSSYYL
jgi:hypothetical protein